MSRASAVAKRFKVLGIRFHAQVVKISTPSRLIR